ncbi:MAG: hypothetical protein EZS28_037761, partial [Streblomastix strix]
ASVIGEVKYTRVQSKRGALHIQYLLKLKDKEVASRGWNKWTQLNRSAIPDITWWINKLAHHKPLCFMKPNRWITIQTDVSSSGWGATLTRENKEKIFAYGEWKSSNLISSNQRQVTVALRVLLEFRLDLIQQLLIGIQLLTYNTVTLNYLNKAEQYNCTIEASHISSLLNIIPDSQSRFSRCGDYAIKREVLQKTLKEIVIQISIEIFATRANRQCTRKFKKERVPIAVLIAPEWPNQQWFNELIEIAMLKICLKESTQVLLMGAKHRYKGWVLPFGLIYLFIVGAKTEKSFSDSCCKLEDQVPMRLTESFLIDSANGEHIFHDSRQQPQIIMANYSEDATNLNYSDNSVKNQRCALAILLKLMENSEKYIHYDLVKQLRRKIRIWFRQTDKQKQIKELDILLNCIKEQIPLLEHGLLTIEQRRAIAATLVMVFTVARLAELHRAVLFSSSDDEYVIQTTILKSLQRIADFKICKIPEERICPLRWFQSWFTDREIDILNKAQELWMINHPNKYIQTDDLSKSIRAVIQSASIIKTYSITSIRAAAITKLLKHNFSRVQVDRFTHHSDTASTIRQYYDKNKNVEAREVFGQTEEELDNEKDGKQKKALLEKIDYERSKVEQRMPSSVGVLCPVLH